MGLSYHFTLNAPAQTKPEELLKFLKRVECEAKKLDFKPTMALSAQFDTEERRQFARRLTTGYPIEDERLKAVAMPNQGTIWHHGAEAGIGHAVPQYGIVLVVTNERGQEAVFGFMRYPEEIKDINGAVIASTGLGGRWFFRTFIDSPDPRYRRNRSIV